MSTIDIGNIAPNEVDAFHEEMYADHQKCIRVPSRTPSRSGRQLGLHHHPKSKQKERKELCRHATKTDIQSSR